MHTCTQETETEREREGKREIIVQEKILYSSALENSTVGWQTVFAYISFSLKLVNLGIDCWDDKAFGKKLTHFILILPITI